MSRQKSIYTNEYQAMLAVLRQMRDDAGVTQEAIAQRLGIQQSMYSKWERGERRIDFVEVCEIVDKLGFKFSEFARRFEKEVKAG